LAQSQKNTHQFGWYGADEEANAFRLQPEINESDDSYYQEDKDRRIIGHLYVVLRLIGGNLGVILFR
jgi:hypothetical protein